MQALHGAAGDYACYTAAVEMVANRDPPKIMAQLPYSILVVTTKPAVDGIVDLQNVLSVLAIFSLGGEKTPAY